MSQFLPNSPDAGGGPVSLDQILTKLAESHLDTTEDFINRLSEWRAHGAISEEVRFLADKHLMQQAENLRAVIQLLGA
ncbi:hypothetical protein [Hymenobacter metallilatus]|uniref:Uncharacterized protein n=1 Tax=Hymenobacter metallilatus TaxID=2493666 RepID=A0A428IYY8_9BACT|nr:hypothetical protein [Hymenobacter metallilatus]RSK24206.1 hypothetical protein EI290_20720 [Hymenobacter metallilatus]